MSGLCPYSSTPNTVGCRLNFCAFGQFNPTYAIIGVGGYGPNIGWNGNVDVDQTQLVVNELPVTDANGQSVTLTTTFTYDKETA